MPQAVSAEIAVATTATEYGICGPLPAGGMLNAVMLILWADTAGRVDVALAVGGTPEATAAGLNASRPLIGRAENQQDGAGLYPVGCVANGSTSLLIPVYRNLDAGETFLIFFADAAGVAAFRLVVIALCLTAEELAAAASPPGPPVLPAGIAGIPGVIGAFPAASQR